ncbi:hypothetical protein OVA10_23395 [Lelliottia sp. SL45]|uniref:fimbrial protein n=1 Tax=Lelliottia sp. SL45 TaxID=2994665 RepID=UPI002275C31C|nr:hypothetical protein [Lelliottia sp. SL45]MCY1700960.1 hypothetical protein [Lelliottia sp. SL45]
MKKLFFWIFFSAFLTKTPAIAGSDSVVFSIHGVLGASPCSLSVTDLNVPLEDADVTELQGGKDVFGANFLIPFTCSSAGAIVFQFDGNHRTDASLLNTTQPSVALKTECTNAFNQYQKVVFGDVFQFGNPIGPVNVDIKCNVFYKKITGLPDPSPGPVNASLTMTISLI